MGFRKYADVESARVLTPKEQAEIAKKLAGLGKTSARQLTDDERQKTFDS